MRRKHFRWHHGGPLDRPLIWLVILGLLTAITQLVMDIMV